MAITSLSWWLSHLFHGGYHISFMVAITSLLTLLLTLLYDITPSHVTPLTLLLPLWLPPPHVTQLTTSLRKNICYSDRKYKSENAIKTAHKLTKKAVHRLTNRQNYTTNLSSKTLTPAQSGVLALGLTFVHSHKLN